MRDEQRFTTGAIALHIAQIWRNDLPHQAFLSGMLAEFLGDEKSSRNSLECAFATASPNEHDYLTTAHILWYHYLDAGDVDAAKRFVLSLYRSASQEHLDEINETIEDTYARNSA